MSAFHAFKPYEKQAHVWLEGQLYRMDVFHTEDGTVLIANCKGTPIVVQHDPNSESFIAVRQKWDNPQEEEEDEPFDLY